MAANSFVLSCLFFIIWVVSPSLQPGRVQVCFVTHQCLHSHTRPLSKVQAAGRHPILSRKRLQFATGIPLIRGIEDLCSRILRSAPCPASLSRAVSGTQLRACVCHCAPRRVSTLGYSLPAVKRREEVNVSRSSNSQWSQQSHLNQRCLLHQPHHPPHPPASPHQ